MRKLYKDGEEFTVDDDQIKLMTEAGWSLTKAESEIVNPEPEESDEDTEDSEGESSDAPTKKVIRKPIKKRE
jgi:hypothetical protein